MNDVLIALRVAKEVGLTPFATRLLLAIRAQENGGEGREWGVLSVPAATCEAQARVCARSIINNNERWYHAGMPGEFVEFMGERWAPTGAENDPKGLNKNWAPNVRAFMKQME